MQPIFIIGKLGTNPGLPKVTGDTLAGLLLNSNLTHFISESFIGHTTLSTTN